jgi:putative ABC transport system permease protein
MNIRKSAPGRFFPDLLMLGNYFKVTSRSMQKRKFYSFINAFGLSIAFAFCILIYLFIQDERSFDQFHPNRDLIYRIEAKRYEHWQSKDPYRTMSWIQAAIQPVVKDECPEVEYATRYSQIFGIVRNEDNIFTEEITYVDRDFFAMFAPDFINGNPNKIFSNSKEIAITPEFAKKYFGEKDPIGKTLLIEQDTVRTFVVSAIVAPQPANSSIHYNMLVAQQDRPRYRTITEQWGNFSTPTFVQLRSNANDPKSLKRNLEKLRDKYLSNSLEEWRRLAKGAIPDDVVQLEFVYTSLSDIHMNPKVSWEKASDPQYSILLGGISLLILVIACINYISLALTSSATRQIEVGIRKVVGAQKCQLVKQFGIEAIVLAAFSMIIGLGLVSLFLPAFNSFTNKEISLTINNASHIIGFSIILSVLVGVLAGSYPALFLSRFKPASILKGRLTTKVKVAFTRSLVVMQFALSAFLIISSVIMYKQMRYVTTKELGYNGDQVIVVPTYAGRSVEGNRAIEHFRNRAKLDPSFINVAGTSASFNKGIYLYSFSVADENKTAFFYTVDPEFIPTLDIELIAGRNFDPSRVTDSTAVIVNEALVRDLKWSNPLNERLNWRGKPNDPGSPVIGVVKDYHFQSLERKIEPMVLTMEAGFYTTLLIKVAAGDLQAGIEKTMTLFRELFPGKPFEYTFVDDDVAMQYQAYKRWMNIMGFSTGFAILISCLGLFGLAGINALNRTKEVSIRKIMGASLSSILILLNKPYIVLSLISYLVAIPISWHVMQKWLESFQFRIAIGWELFAVSILGGLAVALVTVSYHSIRAALINPAETLKNE